MRNIFVHPDPPHGIVGGHCLPMWSRYFSRSWFFLLDKSAPQSQQIRLSFGMQAMISMQWSISSSKSSNSSSQCSCSIQRILPPFSDTHGTANSAYLCLWLPEVADLPLMMMVPSPRRVTGPPGFSKGVLEVLDLFGASAIEEFVPRFLELLRIGCLRDCGCERFVLRCDFDDGLNVHVSQLLGLQCVHYGDPAATGVALPKAKLQVRQHRCARAWEVSKYE